MQDIACRPNADTMRGLDGGWSYSWQGHIADKFAEQYNTILEAMQNKFGKANVVYEPGVVYDDHGNWQQEDASGMQKAVDAAAGVDVIVACIGENSYCETPGNLSDINISRNQLELVKALEATASP